MMRIRKIATVLLLACVGLLALGMLLYYVIAPPYKNRFTYILMAYHLDLGYRHTDDLSYMIAPDEYSYIVGPPNATFTGESLGWYRNGNIAYIERYLKGKIHGKMEYYNPDGSLLNSIESQLGRFDGYNKIYWGQDEIHQFTYYHAGVPLVFVRIFRSLKKLDIPDVDFYLSCPLRANAPDGKS